MKKLIPVVLLIASLPALAADHTCTAADEEHLNAMYWKINKGVEPALAGMSRLDLLNLAQLGITCDQAISSRQANLMDLPKHELVNIATYDMVTIASLLELTKVEIEKKPKR